jgi:metal-responsive CopG/Arc/MetJ family transcriptional regulator
MTQQIAIRIPDDLVGYLDEAVRSGAGSSRAAIITRALERERRRDAARRDVAILAAAGGYPDLDALVRFTSAGSIDVD